MRSVDSIFKEDFRFLKSISDLTKDDIKEILGEVYVDREIEIERIFYTIINNIGAEAYTHLKIHYRLASKEWKDTQIRVIEYFENTGSVYLSVYGDPTVFVPSLEFKDSLINKFSELNYNIKR